MGGAGPVDVTFDTEALDGDGGDGPGRAALVKLQAAGWELNVRGPVAGFLGLKGVREADWAARGSLAVGRCAGAGVFWAAAGGGEATILVGHDDETWDVAVTVPLATVDEIVAAAERCLLGRPGGPAGA